MKYKLFEEYNEEENDGHPGFLQSKEGIHEWLKKYDKEYDKNTYIINDDWSVDVDGSVNISQKKLEYIQVEFNEVSGSFYCFNNKLTTLEGASNKAVDFWCFNNKLTSLEGVPTEVNGHFDCSHNKLTSLEEGPSRVGGKFDCSYNNLITLEHAPTYVGKEFDCRKNKLLILSHTSKVKGEFKHDKLQVSIEERVQKYIDYLQKDNNPGQRVAWLHKADPQFHKLFIEHLKNNNIDISGVNVDLQTDAFKHNDSGLF